MTTEFQLFRASLSSASSAVKNVACSFCSRNSPVGFKAGIGADIIASCCSCGTDVALDADDREDGTCPKCKEEVAFPVDDETIYACPSCLARGRVAFTKDTELGMVTWENANEGWTHGLPGFESTEWTTRAPDEEGWVRVQVDKNHLLELVRTPGYPTIQGDHWLFCCHEPMAFVGEWSRQRFADEATDGDGKALFEAIVEEIVPGLWEDELHDATGVYVFECTRCERRRAHWDLA